MKQHADEGGGTELNTPSNRPETSTHHASIFEKLAHHLDGVQERYMHTITIHGLPRVFQRGRPHERIIWACLLIGMTAFLFYSLHQMVAQYFEYQTFTVREALTQLKMEMPSANVLCGHTRGVQKSMFLRMWKGAEFHQV